MELSGFIKIHYTAKLTNIRTLYMCVALYIQCGLAVGTTAILFDSLFKVLFMHLSLMVAILVHYQSHASI